MSAITAKSTGLVLCHDCHKLLRCPVPGLEQELICPRCAAAVHQRRPQSIAATWALTLTALILLIPANLYPIMTIIYLGEGAPSTIIDGILLLVQEGMIPIALIIFIASIAVPFLKITGIVALLLSVKLKQQTKLRQRTVLFRMVEWIGRWSMLDIFVIAILAKLVEMGKIAQIQAGVAAAFFGLAVIITMLAALSFDPRLIWDSESDYRRMNYGRA